MKVLRFVASGLSLATAALLASQAASGEAALTDGPYDCGGGYTYRHMGYVDIKGGQFRYRPYDEVVNGFAPYSLEANGAIRWGGQFGGLDEAPAKIVLSKREAWGFNVMYQGNPNGLVNTMSCHAPGK